MDDDLDERVVRPGFHARVFDVVRRIPPGKVATYGLVATVLGSPRVARQVGWALAALRDDEVPWHRVLNAKGAISHRGDTGRCVLQQALLEQEGVVFDASGRVDLAIHRWRPDEGDPP